MTTQRHMQQKGFIPIIVGLIVSLFLLIIVYGIGMGVLSMFSNGFMGAATGYDGGCGSSGDVTCPSGTLAGIVKSKANIDRINKNMDFYKEVATKVNIPWEVVAGITYRENSNSTSNHSWSNGREICNNDDGTYSKFAEMHGHPCSSKLDDAIGAMDHLQGKVGSRLRSNVWDENLIKLAMFRYNGASERYKDQAVALGFSRDPGYDGSPYVMSNFDERHSAKKYRKCCVDRCKRYDYCESQDGAFTVASLIKNAELDSNGKIVSLGGCKAASPGSTGQISTCATSTSETTSGGFGPEIKGQFYPPYGDAMKKATPHRASSPHGSSGHGIFGIRGFDKGSPDGAIDYNIPASSDQPIYASFDGKITKVNKMHHPKGSTSRYGGVLRLMSSDKTTGAVYAHIEFSDDVKVGREFKKGEIIGRVAKKCGHGTTMCVDFKSSIHLHYELYINKKGLTRAQLLDLFPLK